MSSKIFTKNKSAMIEQTEIRDSIDYHKKNRNKKKWQ